MARHFVFPGGRPGFALSLLFAGLLVVLLLPLRAYAQAPAAPDPLFRGKSPPVAESTAMLYFKPDVASQKVFSWISTDPVLGKISSGGFVGAKTWNVFPASAGGPARLVFIASSGGATYYGNVLFAPYNRAVVDVTTGAARIRYLLKLDVNPPCDCMCQQFGQHTSKCKAAPAHLGATLGGKSGNVSSESGEVFQYATDLAIPGRPGAEGMLHYVFQREYRSQADTDGPLGHNWNHNYFERLEVQIDGSVIHNNGLDRNDHYRPTGGGEFIAPPEVYTRLTRNPDGSFALRYRGGTLKKFDAAGRLQEIRDRNDNFMTFHYNGQGQLERVNDTLGRDIVYRYSAGRLYEIEDFIGRKVTFSHDGRGDLVSVTSPAVTGTPNGNDFPLGKTTRYTYSTGFADESLNHNLLTVTRPNEVAGGGPAVLTNVYGTGALDFDKVVRQIYGGTNASGVPAGGTFNYAYTLLNAGLPTADTNLPVSRTRETDRNGNVKEYEYNRLGYPVVKREFTNRNVRPTDPDVYETRMEYNADGRLLKITHPEGNVVESTYHESNPDRLAQGNLLTERRIPDPARISDQPELLTRYTYESAFNHIETMTDPRGHTTYFFYDARGNLLMKQEPTVILGTSHQTITDYTYNQFGQMTSETDPEGNVDEFLYFPENDPDGDGNTAPGTRPGLDTATGGYLKEKITDSVGSVRRTEATPPVRISNRFFYDPVGNTIRTIDGRGNDRLLRVNQLNQVVRTESPLPFRYVVDTFYDANDNVKEGRVENRIAGESDRKPVFTGDGNFTAQPGSPAFFSHNYKFDILDRLVEKNEDATGSTPARLLTRYRYDANQNRIREIYPEGNTFAWAYDERDLLFTQTRGLGTAQASTFTYSYDRNRNLVEVCDAQNHGGTNCSIGGGGDATKIGYDGFDRRVRTVDASGNAATRNYDPNGNVVRISRFGSVGGAGPTNVPLSEREIHYDELNRAFQRDDRLFMAAGVVTVRPTLLTDGALAPGDGKVSTRTVFDRNSRPVQAIQDDLDTTMAEFDGVDRVVRTTDPEGNTMSYEYDGNNNLIRIRHIELSQKPGLSPEIFVTTNQYDALDRRTRVSDNCANTNRYAYDSRNNLTHATDAKADGTVGCSGIMNAQGNSMRYTYDGMRRRLKAMQDLRVGGVGSGPIDKSNTFNTDGEITTTSVWDGNSRLRSLADDKGNLTRYAYDALNRLTTEIFADNTTRTYNYDRDDNPANLKDNNGTIQVHLYDAINRRILTSVTRAPGVIGTTLNTYEYDGLSRMTRMTDNNDPGDLADDSVVSFAYDSLSRVVEETQNGKAISSRWLGGERRTALIYPNARTIELTHDRLDQVKTIRDSGAPVNIVEYDYIGPGRVLERRQQNGVRLAIGYDGARRMVAHNHLRADNSQVVGFTHAYDREHNKRFEEKLHIAGQSELYAYDSTSRLVDFKRGQLKPGKDEIDGKPQKTQAWTLDGVGNWRVNARSGLPPQNRAVNQMNEYTAIDGAPFTHDDNGNITNDRSFGLRWDYLNRLKQVCALDPALRNGADNIQGTADDCSAPGAKVLGTYHYDAMNRRSRKTVTNSGPLDGTTDFYYDGWRVLEERTGADTLTQQYVYGGVYIDEPLALDRNLNGDATATGPGDERLFYHQNTLYSVFALTDMSGVVVEGYQYDAYGEQTVFGPGFAGIVPSARSARGNPYMFNGQRLDPETGLGYWKLRSYSYNLGRFLNRNPWGYIHSLPNLYDFVSNRPTKWLEPMSGEVWEKKPGRVAMTGEVDVPGVAKGTVTVRTDVHTARGLGLWNQRDQVAIKYAGENCGNCCWVQFLWREFVIETAMGQRRLSGGFETTGGYMEFTTEPGVPKWKLDGTEPYDPCYDSWAAKKRTANDITMYDIPGSGRRFLPFAKPNDMRSTIYFESYLYCDKKFVYKVEWRVHYEIHPFSFGGEIGPFVSVTGVGPGIPRPEQLQLIREPDLGP